MNKTILIKIWITVALVTAVFADPFSGQIERYDETTHALVTTGSFALDDTYEIKDKDLFKIGDKSYSVIPPGLPVLFAPLYAAYYSVLKLFDLDPNWTYFWPIFNFLTILFYSAPIMATAAVACSAGLTRFTESKKHLISLPLMLTLGSPALFYAVRGIWSHSYAMAFITIGLGLVLQKKYYVYGAIALVCAQLIDYASLVPNLMIFGLCIYDQRRNSRQIIARTLGPAVLVYSSGLCLLMIHNFLITGPYLTTVNSLFAEHLRSTGVLAQGISTFSLPSGAALWGLSFSPFRGLFMYFPPALLALYLVVKNFGKLKGDQRLFMAAILSVFIFNASYYAWTGDSCFGPRHLVFTLPFIVHLLADAPFKLLKWFGLWGGLVAIAGATTSFSANVFINIMVLAYRGPFLFSVDYLHNVVLPKEFGIEIYEMYPFTVFVILGLVLYFIWKKPNASAVLSK